jgi:two-component system, sensor histidine kinase and response regulator
MNLGYIEPMSQPALDNIIFVIDDDEIVRLSCAKILHKEGYQVETFGNGYEGIERLQQVKPPLLLVDIKMPELDGFEVIKRVRAIDSDIVIVVITGYATVETAVDAMRMGAYDFLPKPFTPGELKLIVGRSLEKWQLIKNNQRLKREKEEVERKFATLLSHQLTSPLGAVKQYLDVLLCLSGKDLPQQAVEWITRSQVRLDEMLSLIHDWLTLSEIDRGALSACNSSVNLEEIVDDVIRECRQLPSAEGIEMTASFPAGLPCVHGDIYYLKILAGNLIGNAVKYNRSGGTVSVSARQENDQVVLEVVDTGIGIPEEFIPHLFEEFCRVKSKETQRIPGTGLGLVISKRIVTELGGSIEASSKLGECTIFTVSLPVAHFTE